MASPSDGDPSAGDAFPPSKRARTLEAAAFEDAVRAKLGGLDPRHHDASVGDRGFASRHRLGRGQTARPVRDSPR